MVSSVKSRLDHYQTLGLDPRASAEEISQAFGARMSSFSADPLGRAVQLCIAHETLRDPAKRRDYDRALGIGGETRREQHRSAFALTHNSWAPVIASARRSSIAQSPARSPVASEPHVTRTPEPQAPVDPRLSAIARSVRELARSADRAKAPGSDLHGVPGARDGAEIGVDALIEQIRLAGRAEKERLKAEAGASNGRRLLVTLGALVAGAALCGAIAGLSLKGDETPAEAKTALPAVHRAAPRQRDDAALTPSPGAFAADTAARSPAPNAGSSRSRHHRALRAAQQLPEKADARPSAVETIDRIAPASAPAQAAEAAAASLPLPTALVARTIDRIGYRCGAVASTSAVAGAAPGVFAVTCTSGQSYRAAPVGGRYHFRRLPG